MNPTHLETYIDGLQKTLNDKLFFVDVLGKDFFKNKIIIDFGCGDGTVLNYIGMNCNCEDSTLIGIDINDKMLGYARQSSKNLGISSLIYLFHSLDEAYMQVMKPIFKFHKRGEKPEVVFIATSVLHELNAEQMEVYNFVRRNCDYLIVRDMYACVNDSEQTNNDLLSKLVLNSNVKLFSNFIQNYGCTNKDLIHYLLKYTYVENWETEIKEDYLSVNWSMFEKALNKVVFDRSYIQKWRAERVETDFNVKLSDFTRYTHRELILKREKGK